MPAIKKHSTETNDQPWDGSANVANVRSGESPAYYARIYAWQDPEKDPETKTAYKFPHHLIAAGGDPGDASTKACQSGIGILNGAMGGAEIPSGDRQGVYNHLAGHLEDAGLEPAELGTARGMGTTQNIERRALSVPKWVVVRSNDAGDEPARIEAFAAVFDQMSDDLGGFVEVVHRGAFAETIKANDIRALYNHNPDYVLGRNRAGTLALAEDDHGLKFIAWPPATQWAGDLLTSMERGDISQGSFGFNVIRDELEYEKSGRVIRHLLEVRLYDVSIVTFPAYPQTSAEVRARIARLQTPAPGSGDRDGGAGDGEISRGRRSLLLAQARLNLARRGRYVKP